MTKNSYFEIKKIRKLIGYKNKNNNSLIILEKNEIDRDIKNYNYNQFSEFLRFENEFNLINSFSEIIFLEIFDHNLTIQSLNGLLQQTMELMINGTQLANVCKLILKLLTITNWNLINLDILLRFTSFYDGFTEAKGIRITKEAKEKKVYGNCDDKEFFAAKLEKIRVFLDKKNFLVSGFLTNNLFRLTSWNFLTNSEKKVFSEQITRILFKNQDLKLISKFYFIILEKGYPKITNCIFYRTCSFLSYIYFRISINSFSNSKIEKLLKMNLALILDFKTFDIFENKNISNYNFMNRVEKTVRIVKNFMPIKDNCFLNKIRRSLKAKLIDENIKNISFIFKSVTVKSLKNLLKIDIRDLEYHVLTIFQKEDKFKAFDHFKGILYLNLI
jgi:hypothetical protein